MKQVKHTPGPWKAGGATIDGMNGQQLAVVPNSTKPGTRLPMICLVAPAEKMNDVDLANANLIAAAPDLLDAAKGALLVIELHYSENCVAANSLRAAISKAEKGV